MEDDPSAALFTYFIEKPFLLQFTVDVDLIECDPSAITSTPAFFNTVVTHLLEM